MTIDDMLGKLDLHGVVMLQGMLVNRALQLMQEQKEPPKEAILVPDKKIII